MSEAFRKALISSATSGTNSSKTKKNLQQTYLNQFLMDEYDKAKEEAKEEYKRIIDSSKVTARDFNNAEPGVDLNSTDPYRILTTSIMQDIKNGGGPLQTTKKVFNATNKRNQTLANYYDGISKKLASPDISPEEYKKNKILLEMIEDTVKRENNNLISMKENFEKSTLRGVQNFALGLEQTALAKAIDNQYVDVGMKIAGLPEEEREAWKKKLFNESRKYLTSQGENDIALQQRINDMAYDGVLKFGMDAGFTVGEMTVPILMGIATGNIATSVGAGAGMSAEAIAKTSATASKIASLGAMYADVFGHSYTDAIDKNASTYQANLYAHAMASAEVIPEIIGGETIMTAMVGRPSTSLLGKFVSKNIISKVGNKALQATIAIVTDVGGEAVEEVVTGLAEPAIKQAILGGDGIDGSEVMAELYNDAIGSIIPSMIFMGFSKPMVIAQVNSAESRIKTQIQNATYLTEEQKYEMNKKITEVSADARLGINENYDNIFSAVQGEIDRSFATQSAIYNSVADLRQFGLSGQAMDMLLEDNGYVYNTNFSTEQQLNDMFKNVETSYSNMDVVNDIIQKAMSTDSSITSITPVTSITKDKQNIKDFFANEDGSEVVFAQFDVKNGEIQAFISKENPNIIIVNKDLSTKDTVGAIRHEQGHHIKEIRPELYNEFIKKAGLEGENNPKVQKFKNDFGITNESDDYAREEMFGNYVGETKSRTKEIQAIEESKKTLGQKAKESIGKLGNKTFGTEINNKDIGAYNLDITSYMDGDILADQEFENKIRDIGLEAVKEETKEIKKRPLSKKAVKETTEEADEETPDYDSYMEQEEEEEEPEEEEKPKKKKKNKPKKKAETKNEKTEDDKVEVDEKEQNMKEIRARYKNMKNAKKYEIDKMIADVIGTNDKKEVGRYFDMLQNGGVKYSRTVTKDNNGRELAPGQQKWIEDISDEYINSRGELIRLYHGSNNGEFFVFDKDKASVEGDWGAGFYLTDNEWDVDENYYGGGPDFENKVSRLAEQIQDESETEMSYAVAKEKAREQLEKGEYKIESYGKAVNPAVVGKTRLFEVEDDDLDIDRDDYEDEDRYYEDLEEERYYKRDDMISDAIQAVRDVYGSDVAQDTLEAISELELYEGVGLQELKDKINEKYSTDDEGNLIGNEIARIVIESQGYDGIIDPTVSKKFKNMNLEGNTRHYIFFKSNQIKDIDNLNPTENDDIRYSRIRDNENKRLTPQIIRKYKNSQAREPDGSLLEIYHTMTDPSSRPFNKFDPPRDLTYRFNGQTVIYGTSSRDVSDSYARVPNDIKTVTKARVNNLQEAEKWIAEIAGPTMKNFYKIRKLGDKVRVYYDVEKKFGERTLHLEFSTYEDFKRNFVNRLRAEHPFQTFYWQFPMYMNITNPYKINANKREWNDIVLATKEQMEKYIKEEEYIKLLSNSYNRDTPFGDSFVEAFINGIEKMREKEYLYEESVENEDPRETRNKLYDEYSQSMDDWYNNVIKGLEKLYNSIGNSLEIEADEGAEQGEFLYEYNGLFNTIRYEINGLTKESIKFLKEWLENNHEFFGNHTMAITYQDRKPTNAYKFGQEMLNAILTHLKNQNKLEVVSTNDIVKKALRHNFNLNVANLKNTKESLEKIQGARRVNGGWVIDDKMAPANQEARNELGSILRNERYPINEQYVTRKEEGSDLFAKNVLERLSNSNTNGLNDVIENLKKNPQILKQFYEYFNTISYDFGAYKFNDQILERYYSENKEVIKGIKYSSIVTFKEDANRKFFEALLDFIAEYRYNTTQKEILAVGGYDGVFITDVYDYGHTRGVRHPADLYVAFDPTQVDLVDNRAPTNEPDLRYSRTGNGYRNLNNNARDQIIANQLNEIERLKAQRQADEMWAKRTGRAPLVEQLARQKARLKGYQMTVAEAKKELAKLTTQGEKDSKKIRALKDIIEQDRYEKAFLRRSKHSNLHFDLDDIARYVLFRFQGDSDKVAWEKAVAVREDLDTIKNSIDYALETIRIWHKNYKKLTPELKKLVDQYDRYYLKGRKMTAENAMNMVAVSDYIKANLLGKVPITKNVLNKVLLNDELPISLADAITTKEQAIKFREEVAKLNAKVQEQLSRNATVETAKMLKPNIDAIDEASEKQIKINKVPNANRGLNTLKNAKNQLFTLKSRIESMYGGDPNTPALSIDKRLKRGEHNKRAYLADTYDIFANFMTKSSALNGLMQMYRWKPEYEKMLSRSSEFKEWIKGTPKMSKAMVLSLYLHSLNDDNLKHITGAKVNVKVDEEGVVRDYDRKGGGVLIPNEKEYRKGLISEAYKHGKEYVLTPEQVKALVGTLTEKEKAFADTVSEYYKYSTNRINEVSRRVFGYDIATVENYFPIHAYLLESFASSKEMDIEDLLNGYKATFAGTNLFNQGQLQERTNSFSPIYLENIVDVLTRSVNDTATFYGYAEPLRENKILLDTVYTDEKTRTKNSVKAQLSYLDPRFLNDYNELVNFIVGADGFGKRTFRNWQAMNTLTFNVGTWLTQPASFFNTYKYYKNIGEFISALAKSHTSVNRMIREYYEGQGIDTRKIKNFELMRMFIRETTPVLDARALNFRTPLFSQLVDKKLKDKLPAKFLQLFDDLAVSMIARMQIANTANYATFGTLDYFQMLGENLETIMGETQPDSAEVNKAMMMRNKNPLVQGLTLFGTPSNQIANNFAQSSMNLWWALKHGTPEQKKQYGGTFARAVGGIIASNVAVALIRALRDKIRDDEDEVEFRDRVIAQAIISTASPTVIGDEVASWIMSNLKYGGTNFYDLDTPDTAMVNNIVSTANRVKNLFNENISPMKKTTDLIKAIGSVAPIDTRSLIHITEALLKFTAPDVYAGYSLQQNNNAYKKWSETANTPMAEFYRAYNATREKSLENNYGWVKGSKAGTAGSKKSAYERALKDVLPNSRVSKYMEILGGYKK